MPCMERFTIRVRFAFAPFFLLVISCNPNAFEYQVLLYGNSLTPAAQMYQRQKVCPRHFVQSQLHARKRI